MTAYVTQAQIIGDIPQKILNDALDDDASSNPAGIAAVLAQVIANASQAVDGRLGARYQTPFTGALSSVIVTAGGADYTEPPVVVFTGTATALPVAEAVIKRGVLVAINITGNGVNCGALSVSFTGGGAGAGAAAIAVVTIPAAVLRAAYVFAVEEIYRRREITDDKNPWTKEASGWRQRLDDVAARKMPLDATLEEDLVAAAGSQPFVQGRIPMRGDWSR